MHNHTSLSALPSLSPDELHTVEGGTKELSGDAARSFLQRHFQDNQGPGPVKGLFHYVNRKGQTKRGYADCFVPAMGGESDGFQPSCSVTY
jgi:hypothetical protein